MFFDFSIKDLIDILLVAYMLYQTYRLMKDSGSITIFTGILIFIGCWLIVSQVLEMRLLGSIFDKLVSVGVLALIVLFQDEIRKFLVTLLHRQAERAHQLSPEAAIWGRGGFPGAPENFLGWWKVLCLDCGGGYTTIWQLSEFMEPYVLKR